MLKTALPSRLVFAAASLALAACNCSNVTVTVAPETVVLESGKTQKFAATVTGASSTDVTWSVEEGERGGGVDNEGNYIAPAVAGTFHVVATSVATPTAKGRAVITVIPLGSGAVVSIAPKTASLLTGQTQQFVASVAGGASNNVLFSVQEGAAGGAVSSTGLYTAPSTPGTYHVVATSQDNLQVKDTATVTVTLAPTVGVTINPSTLQLGAAQTQQFTASVSGATNTAVTWSVQEGGSGGTVTSGGFYTAPVSPGSYHVLATSVADPSKSATATVTVIPVTIVVTPSPVLVEIGSTQQFTATVSGAANPAATWAVQEGTAGGAVTSGGLYTPPSTPGTFHVVATSVADGTKSAGAVANVINPVTVTLAPSSASLQMQQTQQFTATVNGSTNQSVTWSVKEGAAGGSITTGGLYTAPVVAATQTFHVVATPQANPAKAAEAVVTVAPGIGVQVTPATVTLIPSATQQFTARVTGASNTAVTWTIQEGASGGAITTGGLYTAPANSGTYHVVATAQADTSKKALATVIVLGTPVNVSGTVTYSGAKTGRVYVVLAPDDASAGIVGTSIAFPGTSATFTLRGMQQRGSFKVRAFMDTLNNGMYHQAKDPFGSVAVTVTNNPLTGVTVALQDETWNENLSTATPALVRVVPSDGSALVVYDPAWTSEGNDECPSYRLLWSTTPNVSASNNTGTMTFTANAPHLAVVRGLTNGDNLYFTMDCPDAWLLGGYAAEVGPVTVGAPTGGSTLNGVVQHNTLNPSNAPLYVVALSDSKGYMTRLLAPADVQNWSLAGVANGTYQVYAFRDVSDDGKLGPTDPNNFFDPVTVTVAGNQTAPTLNLSPNNALVRVTTGHVNDSGSESYWLTLRVRPNVKRPVKAQLTVGSKVAVPVDLPLDETGGARHTVTMPLGTIAPATTDDYTFAVTYSDGTSETLRGNVTAVLPTQVVTAPGALGSTTPTFTWQPLSPAPATPYYTSLRLYHWSFAGIGTLASLLGWADQVPMSTNTLLYTELHPTNASLSSAILPYWYVLTSVDGQGNWSRRVDSFIAQ